MASNLPSSSSSASFSSLSKRFQIGDLVYAEFEDELLPAIVLLEEAGLSSLSVPEYWYFVHFKGKSGDHDCWQPGISLVPQTGIYEAKINVIREIRAARSLSQIEQKRAKSTPIDFDSIPLSYVDPNVVYLNYITENASHHLDALPDLGGVSLLPESAHSQGENVILNEIVFCEHKGELQCATVLASDTWLSDDGSVLRYYYIRYEGCSDRWNEWVDAQTVFVDHTQETLSSILVHLQNIDFRLLEESYRQSFKPGDMCILLHSNGYYYPAVILVCDFSLSVDRIVTFHYRVHILGLSDDLDVWVLIDKLLPWSELNFGKCIKRNVNKQKRRTRILPSIGVPVLKGAFYPSHVPSIQGRQSLYKQGDLIFAEFHGLPYRAEILCVDVWQSGDSKKERSFFLYIEYCGWSTRWQEWIEASLAEPWTTRYQSVPPPPPLIRIYPLVPDDASPQILPAPYLRFILPTDLGLPLMPKPANQMRVLQRIIKGRGSSSAKAPVLSDTDLEIPSPLALLYLCFLLGVAPSFPLLRHWMEDLVRIGVRSNPAFRPEKISPEEFAMLERSILLDQVTILASIFSIFYLNVIVEDSDPFVVNFDLSLGQSKIPVPAINLLRKEMPKFVYIHSRFTYHDIALLAPREFLASCACAAMCSSSSCPCALETGHQILYNEQGLLSLSVLSKPIGIYECNLGCNCSDVCLNRVVQRGSQIPTLVVALEKKGWGLITLIDIPKGSFVVDCSGEIITHDEAEIRGESYDANNLSFLFDLDHEAAHDICRYTIDMTNSGNHARFINHSCNPNLAPFYVWSNTQDKDLPTIALFAIRHIFPGEELTFDYQYPTKHQHECYCGSLHCRKYLC